ncbi:NAD(P)-binding protein [Dothidotthia symphoricarpi CBS 119687]|uniref:NAD(P)-binding protein n=1 Tax=Dothidotthia symphoricarpi CBS 119687 TaxID=1392245 RepID=A0A6A6ACK2_9PLEO|nr:NAD(P)-binding protein [Dothidotthia symphoricarpi CBS 119687]KAF2129549.1 NAD(P)-binding protein [Dothidotthia symphoricarpi CBS 119687]
MVVVAVMGGTGSVGRTIVDALKEDGKHKVIVLARKVPEGENAAPVFAVDYDNIEQLTKTLDANDVHTVISTIMMIDPKAAQAEINMITAAGQSSSTKRFVASHWGNATPDDESIRLPFNSFRDQSAEALRKTDLEWTQIHNGHYSDYFGMPHVDTHLSPLVWAVDIAHKMAAIPGSTGDEVLSFTYTKDLGKFVVAALSLPKWEEVSYCYSDNVSLNQLIKNAEEATGSKFKITYDSVEKLQRGEVTELPSNPYSYDYIPKPLLAVVLSRFGLWVVNGVVHIPKEGSLNEKFPEIATTSVKEVVDAWKGK